MYCNCEEFCRHFNTREGARPSLRDACVSYFDDRGEAFQVYFQDEGFVVSAYVDRVLYFVFDRHTYQVEGVYRTEISISVFPTVAQDPLYERIEFSIPVNPEGSIESYRFRRGAYAAEEVLENQSEEACWAELNLLTEHLFDYTVPALQ